jgi:hypothetical protein
MEMGEDNQERPKPVINTYVVEMKNGTTMEIQSQDFGPYTFNDDMYYRFSTCGMNISMIKESEVETLYSKEHYKEIAPAVLPVRKVNSTSSEKN